MEAAFDDLATSRVGVVCGRGNNGGDGFVVARTLVQRGVDTAVFLLGSVAEVRGDARTNLEVLGRIGMTVVEITNAQEWELHFSELSDCELIVDAILGTGFRGPLTGLLETVVADLNGLGVPIVAIDLPTGLSADSAAVDGTGDRSVDDGDARGAEDPARVSAGRHARRRSGHRRHRHSAAAPRRARGAASRAADARAHARDRAGARRRLAQGRLRPRARRRRIARADRRGAPQRHRRAALGRRPRDDRDAAVVPADRRRHGARVHDRAARRDGVGHRRLQRHRTRPRAQRRRHRRRAGPGPVAGHGGVRPGARSSAPACRSCSTPTR